jgi:hypothetical protein
VIRFSKEKKNIKKNYLKEFWLKLFQINGNYEHICPISWHA